MNLRRAGVPVSVSDREKMEQASEGHVQIARGRADLNPVDADRIAQRSRDLGLSDLAGKQPTLDLRLAGPVGLPPLQPLIGMPIAGTVVSDLVIRGPVMAPPSMARCASTTPPLASRRHDWVPPASLAT